MNLRTRKRLLVLGMAASLLGIALVTATSFFNGSGSHFFTSDKAIILSLNENQAVENIVLSEDEPSYYSITAEVQKSASVTVNATLTIKLEDADTINGITLNDLSFELYEVTSSIQEGVLKDSRTEEIDDELQVTGITTTTEYYLKIFLKEKENGARYSAEELNKIGGKIQVSFTTDTKTSDEGGNA